MAAQVFTHLFVIFACLAGTYGWRCAKYKHYFSQQPDYIDCIWDCCGNSFNRHCCAPIGIIVGCSIVGAVILATMAVVLVCWWQKRRARNHKGPRLFHNRRHSHYPVAPTSVTRPAPDAPPYRGPPASAGYGPAPIYDGPPPNRNYRGPPQPHQRGPPHPQYGYGPPPEQNYDSDRERPGYRPPPRPEYNEKPPLPASDYDSGRDEGFRRPPPGPNRGEKPPKSDLFI